MSICSGLESLVSTSLECIVSMATSEQERLVRTDNQDFPIPKDCVLAVKQVPDHTNELANKAIGRFQKCNSHDYSDFEPLVVEQVTADPAMTEFFYFSVVRDMSGLLKMARTFFHTSFVEVQVHVKFYEFLMAGKLGKTRVCNFPGYIEFDGMPKESIKMGIKREKLNEGFKFSFVYIPQLSSEKHFHTHFEQGKNEIMLGLEKHLNHSGTFHRFEQSYSAFKAKQPTSKQQN
ncbi:hypothetical protein D5018_18160 [Parashewanella curva]|uniref:Uncharacterized protein n=1 Tax=Parashewanella curva TaxID=2338552 RepID=A0A3L8PS73_9GAMM|nr:hypothetical protein [Parashewanella curva]RLV58260.1 hypothetical protein D5018_18160 [Parashewanella curva]